MYNSATLCISILLIIIISNVASGFPCQNTIVPNVMQKYYGSINLTYLGASVFLEPDPEVGKKLAKWNEMSEVNPEELGVYAEGDIVFPRNASTDGLVAKSDYWKYGVIPYEIDNHFTSNDINTIKRAIKVYNRYTCINFRPKRSTDKDYVSIVDEKTGCWSSIGRIGGKQLVNLNTPACTTKVGTVLHELMHTVGFFHEQNRDNRDYYVTIAWPDIEEGYQRNFIKMQKGKIPGHSGIRYNYRSVMHYSTKAFSIKNKLPTIISKEQKYNRVIGQREGLSRGDIININAMYNCPEKSHLPIKGDGIYQYQHMKTITDDCRS